MYVGRQRTAENKTFQNICRVVRARSRQRTAEKKTICKTENLENGTRLITTKGLRQDQDLSHLPCPALPRHLPCPADSLI